MSKLWKKKKGNSRISKFFLNFQTPPKRGVSLVVETGFPTSIIDLFVKNCDRIKKKKQQTTIIGEKVEEKEVEVCLLSDKELKEVEKNENKCVVMDNKCYKVEGGDGNERLDRGVLGNRVICVSGLLGLCVLCSKGFVVGLSIVATLLLLFEFVFNLVVFQWARCCLDGVKMLNVFNFRWVFDGMVGKSGGGVELEFVDERDECGVDVSDFDIKDEIEEVFELKDVCGLIENSNFDDFSEYSDVSSKMGGNVDGKIKKVKKFWKRCVFSHINSKIKGNKQGKETHLQGREQFMLTTCIVSNIGESNDTNFPLLSSSCDNGDARRIEEFSNCGNDSNHNGKKLHKQNITVKSCSVVMYRGVNFECIVVIAIVLVGLIDSRMLALIFTLICCVWFKVMRRL